MKSSTNFSSLLPLVVPLLAAGALASCNLLNTADSEDIRGRGATSFDPYQGERSGAIKLGLQIFNGCAILANGNPVGPGEANIPYPDECLSFNVPIWQPMDLVPPGAPIEIVTGKSYFLDRLSVIESLEYEHTDPNNMGEVIRWMTEESRFRDLDWSGVAEIATDYFFDDQWNRRASFGNAAWQLDVNQSFLVELLDADGNVRDQVLYARNEFLGESATSGHTRLQWLQMGTPLPRFPGDPDPVPHPDFDPEPLLHQSMIRFEVAGSINPFKNLTVDESLAGDGAIRVSWSALPAQPMYFPVRFVSQDDVPDTCFDANNEPTACRYGLDPQINLSPPANGSFYEPGEQFDIVLALKDGEGNYLHPPDRLFSQRAYLNNQSNGVLFANPFGHASRLQERDTWTQVVVSGPIQKMKRAPAQAAASEQFFIYPKSGAFIPDHYRGVSLFASLDDFIPPTRYPVPLPEDAEPGTYLITFKAHRNFMGERVAKTNTFYFNVAQAEPTKFPNRVGNCQLCHRGVISMENIRHGMSVDGVESCKSCHTVSEHIHQLHSRSPKYPMPMADCTVCHLTRESAIRPSAGVCSTCHLGLHGNEYFNLQFTNASDPINLFGNCAQSCHGITPPSGHILPNQ